MNVEIVRRIDYWIGIPVCFFLTLVNFVTAPLKRKFGRKIERPKKFLFIELSEMGSAILAYPAMRYLKDKYPDAELFFMIFQKNRPSVDVLDIIPKDNVLVIRNDKIINFFADVIKNFIRMRREKIDVVFDLELFARATAILAYLSGAPKKIGFYKYNMEGLYRGGFITHKVQYNFQQHISKSFFSFIKIMENDFKNTPETDDIVSGHEMKSFCFKSTPDNIANIWKKLQSLNSEIRDDSRLILFNPSAGELPIRAWPFENYVNLAKKILNDYPECFIIGIGGRGDAELVSKFVKEVGDKRCFSMAEKTTITELLDLYNVSEMLVSNDSGPAQFAALTPIKNFVFFGAETPVLYSPLGENTHVIYSNFPCSPCFSAFNHRETACSESKCLKAISIDYVYNLIEKNYGNG